MVIPVLKMSVHATYFHIEQLRERETFLKSAFFYTEQEKCSYKTLLKEKIHDLMQAFPLDTESH